jgi:hypothetical protein
MVSFCARNCSSSVIDGICFHIVYPEVHTASDVAGHARLSLSYDEVPDSEGHERDADHDRHEPAL